MTTRESNQSSCEIGFPIATAVSPLGAALIAAGYFWR
jgi:hypothetical protein